VKWLVKEPAFSDDERGVLTSTTDTDPITRFQTRREPTSRESRMADPPVYPIPIDLVAKSASIVPTVVDATMVSQ